MYANSTLMSFAVCFYSTYSNKKTEENVSRSMFLLFERIVYAKVWNEVNHIISYQMYSARSLLADFLAMMKNGWIPVNTSETTATEQFTKSEESNSRMSLMVWAYDRRSKVASN